MTDLVTPGEKYAAADPRSMGHAWGKAATGSWIVDGADIAGSYSSLDETAMAAFSIATTSGHDVTLNAGEGYVAGWLARDRTTTRTLPASATTTIYLGYDAGAILNDGQAPNESDNIIIGPDSAFDAGDPRTPLYTFTTDGSGILSAETDDHRQLRKPVEYDPLNDTVDVDATLTERGNPVATDAELSNHAADDAAHHAPYTDTDAVGAIEAEALLALSGDVETPGYVDADTRVSSTYFRLRGSRFHYDPDLSGTATHFQRDSATAETALTFVGTSVGIHEMTNPQAPVHLGGTTRVDGNADVYGLVDNSGGDGVKLPDVAGNLPSNTETGRIFYDSSREQ